MARRADRPFGGFAAPPPDLPFARRHCPYTAMTLVADSQALADVVEHVGASTLAVRGRATPSPAPPSGGPAWR